MWKTLQDIEATMEWFDVEHVTRKNPKETYESRQRKMRFNVANWKETLLENCQSYDHNVKRMVFAEKKCPKSPEHLRYLHIEETLRLRGIHLRRKLHILSKVASKEDKKNETLSNARLKYLEQCKKDLEFREKNKHQIFMEAK